LQVLFHSFFRQFQIGLRRFAIFFDETMQQHDFPILDDKSGRTPPLMVAHHSIQHNCIKNDTKVNPPDSGGIGGGHRAAAVVENWRLKTGRWQNSHFCVIALTHENVR
jgi:hypothetical protein